MLAAAAALALSCSDKQKQAQLSRLEAKVASERAAAVRALAAVVKPDDEPVWVALEGASRDPSSQVKIAAVEALAAAPRSGKERDFERGALADDAISALLGDPDEAVRTAAAQALGKRCGDRPTAYLLGAFNRGGISARAAVAAALFACGVKPEQLFARSEELRRLKAMEWIERSNSAQRSWAATELGLLGRPKDVAVLGPLLDSSDGAVVAAAALGLGHAADAKAAARLARLAADPVPVIAGAAARALTELGPEACRGAQAALEKQVVAEGEQAVPSAVALALAADKPAAPRLCALARAAVVPTAAAVLARGCPLAPLGEELVKLVPSKGPLKPGSVTRATALVEALLQARAEPLPAPAALALGRLAGAGAVDLSERAAEAVGLLGAAQAAPALLALVKPQRAAREKEVAVLRAKQSQAPPAPPKAPLVAPHQETDEEAQAPVGRPPNEQAEKYARLMKLAGERNAKVETRSGAAERLSALLRGQPAPFHARRLLVLALRSLLALQAPEVAPEAAALARDPDREIAAAAQATPGPSALLPQAALAAATLSAEPLPLQVCLDALAAKAPPGKAAPRLPAGCIGRFAAADPLPAAALEAARRSLWSDDGADRAAACALLFRLSDQPTAPLRQALAEDPEQRVRAACAVKKETAPGGAR